jgi:alpha-mannosidase
MQVAPHSGAMPARHSFVSASPENVVLTAMKKAEDSDALVFHLYEWAGKPGTIELLVPSGATGAVETNLLEQPQGESLAISGDKVSVPIKPYGIVAVRVDYSESARR